MKKLITILVVLHLSLFTIHETSAQRNYIPKVVKPVFSGKTKAIRDTRIVILGPLNHIGEFASNPLPDIDFDESLITEDKLNLENTQDFHGSSKGISTLLNIEGMDNLQGGWPADPNGDIGIDHYVQTVNSSFAIYSRSGEILYGPVAYQSIFESFPGPWNEINWCDPVMCYDHMADRWIFTTMSYELDQRIFYEMNAVSITSDPMGEYYCYAYEFEDVNDYPKMSVWPNGYYITYNIFTPTWQIKHSLVSVVDRQAMLDGEPDAVMVQFALEPFIPALWPQSIMSADHNGSMMPVSEACPVLVPECDFIAYPWDIRINMYGLLPDWQDPGNSTLDSIHQFQVDPVFPFLNARSAPQPGNFHDVETVIFYLMYPLHYRNFGAYETMMSCQTLYDGEAHYLRWYEFRKDADDWYMYQAGNYSPDTSSRYMPSISMNGNGDIAMGYTKSDIQLHPSIWLTGRKTGDSLGIMTYEEVELYQGLNYVNNYNPSNNRNRWGDYASMMVDPVNDSTFWYTAMYPKENNNPGNWSTRIIAFNLNDVANEPQAFAGPDTVICMDEMYRTNGEAHNFSYLYWNTDGDGNFLSQHGLEVRYLRGSQDLENGEVKLSLYVEGLEPGSSSCDTMVLYINDLPEVEAGDNDTICCNQSVSLDGQVMFSDDYYWTSTGSGSFNDSTMLDAIYTPALSDTSHDHIILTLYANPLAPCTHVRTDELKLCVESCLGIGELSSKIEKFAVFPNPVKGEMHLHAEFRDNTMVQIRILNNTGKVIFQGIYNTANNIIHKEFDFTHLADGIYYVRLQAGEDVVTNKIIVQ